MIYKYNLNQIVQVNSIVKSQGKIVNRLSKQDINLYQVKVLEGEHREKLLWFAEHELKG